MGRDLLKLVAFLSCLLACAPVVAQTNSGDEIQQHFKRAQEAIQAKQDAVAVQEFREILRLDRNNAEAHANLGAIAFAQKNYAEAAEEFRIALKLRPSLSNGRAYLGMCELRLGNRREAKGLLEDAFRHVQEPMLRRQLVMDLIVLYYDSGELDQIVDLLRELQRSNPNDPTVLFTAYRAYTELAARSLATLAEVAPESAQMHQILAEAQANQDDFLGAIAQYRRALEIDPQLPGIHYELGQVILMNSQKEPARQQAEKELELALAADPTNADCEYMLGEIEWLRLKPQEALKHYSRALTLRPDYVDAHIATGKALTTLGEPEEALVHLLEAVHLDPKNEVAHYRLAQAYRKLERTFDAEHEFTTFRKLRDSHDPVRSLYQQIQQRPVLQQTVDPIESR